MIKKITASDISNYDSCSRKIWLKFFEKDFELAPVSGFMKYLAEQGNIFEKECIDILKETDEVYTPSNFKETISFMKKGVKYIYQAVLEDENRVGHVDLLRRVDCDVSDDSVDSEESCSSIFGNYYYEIIDIKSAILYSDIIETDLDKFLKKSIALQKSYGLQLFHYYELLDEIQQCSDDCDVGLYLWVKDRVGFSEIKFEEKVLNSFKNRKPLEENYLTLFEEIQMLDEDDEIEPFKCSACENCEWKTFCFDKMKKDAHCSLIRGVQKRGLADLNELGIKTISDFYEKVDDKTKIKYVLTGKDSFKTFKLRKQAQSLIEDKDFYIGDSLKAFDEDYLLFYDIEGEMGHEFEYLHGVWEVNQNTGDKRYVSFIGSDKEKEGDVWNEFLDYVKGVKKKGSFKIIYYADYERVAWNNLSERYSTSSKDLDMLMNNSLDILKEWIDNKLILPRYNYSIKTVAPFYGFVWECTQNWYEDENGEKFQLDEANGGESIAWLDYWLSGKEHFKQIILDYNKDDCVATEFVYSKMVERYGSLK